jgi:ParB family chromosome partitioning protein
MLTNIDITRLRPHPNNPRKDLGDLTELAESIKVSGILQNLTVVPVDADEYNKMLASKRSYKGNYTIVIGHRRHAAAKIAGVPEVPCSIALMDEKMQVGTMLLENIQRTDLTYYEQGQGFQLMLDMGESEDSISELTGFSKATIKKRVKLLDFNPKKFKEAEERGATLDDFAKLDKIKDKKTRDKLLEKVGTSNFNWELERAAKKETEAENKKKLVPQLEKFAQKADETKVKKLEYVQNVDLSKDTIAKPKDAEKVKYYYGSPPQYYGAGANFTMSARCFLHARNFFVQG